MGSATEHTGKHHAEMMFLMSRQQKRLFCFRPALSDLSKDVQVEHTRLFASFPPA